MPLLDHKHLDGPQIEQRAVDWGADLAWITLLELGCVGPSLGRPDLIVEAAKIVLRSQQGTGRTVFINPEFTITGSAHQPPSVKFIRESRRAQQAYLKHFRSILFSSRRMKNELKRVDPITRQLAYTGVLIVDGCHVHPTHWPDPKDNRRALKANSINHE
jgi:hypothetical protein